MRYETPALALSLLIVSVHSAVKVAERRTEESRVLRPDGHVIIRNALGRVRVVGHDESRVWVAGSLSEGVRGLEVTGDTSMLLITVALKKQLEGTADLVVHVPRRAQLEIIGGEEAVVVEEFYGTLDVVTNSGDVEVASEVASLHADTRNGDVFLRGGAARVSVVTVGGDVYIDGSREDLYVQTVSGDVEGERLAGSLNVRTVSGNIALHALSATQPRIESIEGEVTLLGALNAS